MILGGSFQSIHMLYANFPSSVSLCYTYGNHIPPRVLSSESLANLSIGTGTGPKTQAAEQVVYYTYLPSGASREWGYKKSKRQ